MADILDIVRQLTGARASARIPVSREMLNRLVAHALDGRDTPVHGVDIQPRAGDQFDAVVTLSFPFAPTLTAAFTIERQPEFPDSPVLELRWLLLGAVGAFASGLLAAFEDKMPAGIRIDGDRLLLNLPVLAARSSAAHIVRSLTMLELHTLDGRLVIDVALAIPE